MRVGSSQPGVASSFCRLILGACLVGATLAASAAEFTGAVDDSWFQPGNWDTATIPTPADVVDIPAGQTVQALASDGSQVDGELFRIGRDQGSGTGSLFSEVPVVSTDWLLVGGARTQGGDFAGELHLDGADLTAVELLISLVEGPSDQSGSGTVTVTDGSIDVDGGVEVGRVYFGGGQGNGSLTVTNGDIAARGSLARLTVGSISDSSPGPVTGHFELRNGSLSGFDQARLGSADSGSGGSTATVLLADASASFTGPVEVSTGAPATADLELDNSWLSAQSLSFGQNATATFHVDGAIRTTSGSVGDPGQYSAMDIVGGARGFTGVSIEPGATLRLDFSYQPGMLTAYDLIRLPVGQTFNGDDFSQIEVFGTDPSLVSTEIIPGTPTRGEVLRLTHRGDAIFNDAFLAPIIPTQM